MILLGYRDEYSRVPLGKQGEYERPPPHAARPVGGSDLLIQVNGQESARERIKRGVGMRAEPRRLILVMAVNSSSGDLGPGQVDGLCYFELRKNWQRLLARLPARRGIHVEKERVVEDAVSRAGTAALAASGNFIACAEPLDVRLNLGWIAGLFPSHGLRSIRADHHQR